MTVIIFSGLALLIMVAVAVGRGVSVWVRVGVAVGRVGVGVGVVRVDVGAVRVNAAVCVGSAVEVIKGTNVSKWIKFVGVGLASSVGWSV